MKKVLVIGGGFAGLESAIYLRKASYDVTLASDRDYFYIYPTSIWVPTRKKEFKEICIDLKKLQDVHGFSLVIDKLISIDTKNNAYTFANGIVLKNYDYIVLAMGASKLKTQGIDNTLSTCGAPEESLKIRDELDALIAKGSGKIAFGFGGNPKDMSAVRGGPAFELLFNVHNLLSKKRIRKNFELTFFAPMPEPGKKMGEKALDMMAQSFKKFKIQQRFGKKIKMFKSDGIVFEDDSKLDTDLTIFIPAGNGHELILNSNIPQNKAGFIQIDDFCRVHIDNEETNIYALGDIVALQGADWRAKQGHIAEVMARNVAHNIEQRDKGLYDFKGYAEHVNILCVMDTGNGASFIYRDENTSKMIPLPIIGHWLKLAWGLYFKLSKLNKIPRIPGM
jgi:sulfide:quinone oxidoreductase